MEHNEHQQHKEVQQQRPTILKHPRGTGDGTHPHAHVRSSTIGLLMTARTHMRTSSARLRRSIRMRWRRNPHAHHRN
eukprot:2224892-Alexandrium_andersonii.AAC.1